MAGRITSQWTADLKGAFGDTPQIRNAIKGEHMWEQFATRTYSKVINHSSDKSKQTAGVDFTIYSESRPITVDVKANMRWGYFYVENGAHGWLRNLNKKTDCIVHIEVRNGWVCEYDRQDMIAYLDSKGYKQDLVRLSSFKEGIQGFVRKYCVKKSYKSKSKSAPSKFNSHHNPYNITISHSRDEKAWNDEACPFETYNPVTDTVEYPYGEACGFSESE